CFHTLRIRRPPRALVENPRLQMPHRRWLGRGPRRAHAPAHGRWRSRRDGQPRPPCPPRPAARALRAANTAAGTRQASRWRPRAKPRRARGLRWSCRRPSLGVGNLPRLDPTERGGGRLARRPVIPIPRREGAEFGFVLVGSPAGLIAAVIREPSQFGMKNDLLLYRWDFCPRLAADHEAERAVLEFHITGARLGLPPAVITGRLDHDGLGGWALAQRRCLAGLALLVRRGCGTAIGVEGPFDMIFG